MDSNRLSVDAPFALLTRLWECAPLTVAIVDRAGAITFATGAVESMTGHQADELVGRRYLDLVDRDWSPQADGAFQRAMDTSGLQRPTLVRLFRKDGSRFVAEVQAVTQWNDELIAGMAIYIRSCDERTLLDRVTESLAAGEDTSETLVLLARVMGAETLEADGAVLLLPGEHHGARVFSAVVLPEGLDMSPYLEGAPWYEAVETGRPVWSPVVSLPDSMRTSAELAGYSWCWAWPITVRSGSLGCLVLWRRADEPPDHTARMLLQNLVRFTGLVLEREESSAQLHFAASHDSLTELANRSQFFERLHGALFVGRGPLVGVLYVDLDEFKEVNDRFGHRAGDHVLRDLGRRFRAVVRKSDLVARIGGDEFAVLCPNVDNELVLEDLADRLVEAGKEPLPINGQPVRIGASVGIACAIPKSCSVETLLERADAALYQAKAGQRGTWRMAEPITGAGAGDPPTA